MRPILVFLLVGAVASAPQGYQYQPSKSPAHPAGGAAPGGAGAAGGGAAVGGAAVGGAPAGGYGAAGAAGAAGGAGAITGGHAAGGAAPGGAAASAGGAPAAKGPIINIVKDERVSADASGAYSFTFETSDGASRTETGAAGKAGSVAQKGGFSYKLPDGQLFTLTFVADENGYQPQSPFLPPLPQFVLDQIEFAKSHPETAGGGATAGAGAGAVAGGAHAGGATAGGATAGGAHAGGATAGGAVAGGAHAGGAATGGAHAGGATAGGAAGGAATAGGAAPGGSFGGFFGGAPLLPPPAPPSQSYLLA